MGCISLAADRCTGCAACVNACPADAVRMAPDAMGFMHPHVLSDRCTNCGACAAACPVLHPQPTRIAHPAVYAAAASDELRMSGSSSGAIYPVLARYTLEHGGVVCAATCGPDLRLRHVLATDVVAADACRGSKYYQSEIGLVFRDIQKLLSSRREVLFVGTPCQVAGLRSFLGCAPDTLVTADLICHGVPSFTVYQKYMDELVQSPGEQVLCTEFRDKRTGWSPYLVATTTTTTTYTNPCDKDLFLRVFLGDIALRQSCGSCPFSVIPRQGDLTIGDFWGIDDFDPTLNDNKGTSVVLVNSAKGERLWECIRPHLKFCQPAPLEAATKFNPNLLGPSKFHPDWRYFRALLQGGMRLSDAADYILSNTLQHDASFYRAIFAELYPQARKWRVRALLHLLLHFRSY